MNLSFLLYLACPIGMGVMMWMMMRGNQGQQTQDSRTPAPGADLTDLSRQLDSLEGQQQAIRAQMRRLQDEDAIEGQAQPLAASTRLEGSSTKPGG